MRRLRKRARALVNRGHPNQTPLPLDLGRTSHHSLQGAVLPVPRPRAILSRLGGATETLSLVTPLLLPRSSEAMEAMVCSLGLITPFSAPECAVLARVGWVHGVATATFLLWAHLLVPGLIPSVPGLGLVYPSLVVCLLEDAGDRLVAKNPTMTTSRPLVR